MDDQGFVVKDDTYAGFAGPAQLLRARELRFLTCGSVDDGKSTLIGRLLHDASQIPDDQLAAARRDSRTRAGEHAEGEIDYSLLVDGLLSEREQGITIDVAYRYFATSRRSFIVADTPGHEQYTRNMVTGASACDLAIILVDARKGILRQTRRHSSIVHLLGIRKVVLAVNKIDLVDYDEERYEEICSQYEEFSQRLGIKDVKCIPVSAKCGDNVFRRSEKMPWYGGSTLIDYLETVDVGEPEAGLPFRMPVQWVNRPNLDFRGFAGTIARGAVRPGDRIVVLPSGQSTRVREIVTYSGSLAVAEAGRAVTLVLEDEVDIGRGDVLAAMQSPPDVADQVAAHVIWMGNEPMLPGRQYLVKCGTQTVPASISSLKHKINVDNLDEIAGRDLQLNDIGLCNLSFSRPIVFEPYERERSMGSFIIIDKMTNATVGAGLIRFGLWRSDNIHWQSLDLNKAARSRSKGQKACCFWFTGLSGSGKSTIASQLERRLHDSGRHTYVLDGDNVRHGLNRDLGFTDSDRVENIRRVAETARLMVDAGLIVIVSFISPFAAERRMARDLFDDGEFIEVFVDTPIETCEARDPKGLYQKARAGLIRNFTGIDSDYEPPEHPEIHLKAGESRPGDLVEVIMEQIADRPLQRR